MTFSTLSKQDPTSDYEKRYTTADADVGTSAVQTTGIFLGGKNKVNVQAQTIKSGGTSTDTVTVKLQGSHDNSIWFDFPATVAGTGQVGSATTAVTADATEVLRLNYDFSEGNGQAKPRFVRVDAVSSAANGTKAVNLDIFVTKAV